LVQEVGVIEVGMVFDGFEESVLFWILGLKQGEYLNTVG